MDTYTAGPECCGCRFERRAPAHHRRLVALEAQPMNSLVELIEMAATWGEIEYGEIEPVIPPDEWIDFAEAHAWDDGNRVFDALVALASLVPRARTTAANRSAPLLVSV
ncbi:hypothetical protein AB0L70_31655 [Kribbella sp. NPDC051952]|uniref:hypothetical protein n=1 Tax=Kribbella sp. NPDC051952 TaxID=3154851 RepID=UPI003441159F